MTPLQQFAAWAHSIGMPPIRVEQDGKRPLDTGWQHTSYASAEAAAAALAGHDGNLGATMHAGLVVLDFDCKDGRDGRSEAAHIELRIGSTLPPTLTQRTPSGGTHMVYRLPPGATVRNGVGVAPGIDVRTSGGQIVVEPSTIGGKPYQWDRASLAIGIAELPGPWVELLASRQRESQGAVVNERRIPKGARNSELASMAGSMRRAGFSRNSIATALLQANAEQCEIPLDSREVQAIADSVVRYAPEPLTREMFASPAALPIGAIPVSSATLPEISVADLFTRPSAPHRFLVEDILPAGVVTLFGAHGGTGKSLLALTMTVCLAAGLPFYGLRTQRTSVVFYSAEDGADVVRRRLSRICQFFSVDPAAIAAQLVVMDATECPVLYNGTLTPSFQRLQERVATVRPGAIFIDNASDTFDASEIERARVREFVRLLASLGKSADAAVMLLAHVDKATVKTGSSEGYSGSTAWHNSARSRLFMTSNGQGVEIEHQKSNLGPRAKTLHLRWNEHHMLESAEAPGGAEDEEAIFRLIQWANVSDRTLSPHPQAANYAHRLLCNEPAYPPRLDRRAFDAVLSALCRGGRVVTEDYQGNDRKTRRRLRAVRAVAPGPPAAPAADHPSAAGGGGLGVWGDRPQPDG